jgi:hypothetical protein
VHAFCCLVEQGNDPSAYGANNDYGNDIDGNACFDHFGDCDIGG